MKQVSGIAAVVLMATCLAGQALADGGTVRAMQTISDCRVTVFTSPAPLRVGGIDVSVLLQDAATGELVGDAEIDIVVQPASGLGLTERHRATFDAAKNKLLRAAKLELATVGLHWIIVNIERPNAAPVCVRCSAEIAPPAPRWLELWPWFTWPAGVIALYALRQWQRFRINPDRSGRRVRAAAN
jgi:hypothetical protein